MRKIPVVNLGGTGLKVSKLGFGTFDFGVPSLGISADEGGRILVEACKLGVNLWDASEDYGSHLHIASALKHVPRNDVVISTKTDAKNGKDAETSLGNSLSELDTGYIDVFMLHNVKFNLINDCHRILNELSNIKTTGLVRAIGLSTHSVCVVREAAQFKELDVVMATCCKANQALIDKFPERIPLEDGSITEMLNALELAHKNGKGVIAMKVLGTGATPLVGNYEASIKSVARWDFVDSMVIGMKNLEEVRKNVKAILSV